jgi:glycosyltransferase involved in cell wall biosynthesis
MFQSRPKTTGFAVWVSLLRRALEQANSNVYVNDFRTTRHNPHYPVGIAGFPTILNDWSLPNPAVLGPGLYDHPMLARDLMNDPRFRGYAVVAPWTREIHYPAGIDLDEWPDLTRQAKKFDFLVYDKVRWSHDEYSDTLIAPMLAELNRRRLTYTILRYSKHDHRAYRRALAAAKGMIFLCEHETQGLAYQEAMASGVPILAWDRGFWADPLWKRFHASPPLTSSVPFFSSTCGEKFISIDDFPTALTSFLQRRASYSPRQFVAHSLNMKQSAEMYARKYFALTEARGACRLSR